MNDILKKIADLHQAITEEEVGNCKESYDMYFNAKNDLDKTEEWILRGRQVQEEHEKNGGEKDEKTG